MPCNHFPYFMRDISLIVTLICILSGCRPKEPSLFYNRIKTIKTDGKVRVEFIYNENGQLSEWKTFLDSDEMTVLGNLRVFRNKNQQVERTEIWTSWSFSSSDSPKPGTPLKEDHTLYYYDTQGRVVKVVRSSPGILNTTYKLFSYNADGLEEKQEQFGVDGKLLYYYTSEYNSVLHQRKSKGFDADGKLQGTWLTEYDNKENPFFKLNMPYAVMPISGDWRFPNNIVATYDVDENGVKAMAARESFKYEYNLLGLPIKRTDNWSNNSRVYEFVYE